MLFVFPQRRVLAQRIIRIGNLEPFLSVLPLVAELLYGCGMRISECLRLHMKDIDFDQALIEGRVRPPFLSIRRTSPLADRLECLRQVINWRESKVTPP